jgi:uncharacterized protein (TIGR02453 family)
VNVVEAQRFLFQLSMNNDRAWFKANEANYESAVREPVRAFIRDMAAPLATVSSHLVADDRKVGGSMMRIQRDVRFSNDKSPYKTHVGIQFRHTVGKDIHAPGVYVHIGPDEVFLGVGMWMPEAEPLRALREAVRDRLPAWQKALAAAERAGFTQHRDALTRVPKGFDKADPAAEELKRRSFIATFRLDDVEVLEPTAIGARVKQGSDYMSFLCAAVGLAF